MTRWILLAAPLAVCGCKHGGSFHGFGSGGGSHGGGGFNLAPSHSSHSVGHASSGGGSGWTSGAGSASHSSVRAAVGAAVRETVADVVEAIEAVPQALLAVEPPPPAEEACVPAPPAAEWTWDPMADVHLQGEGAGCNLRVALADLVVPRNATVTLRVIASDGFSPGLQIHGYSTGPGRLGLRPAPGTVTLIPLGELGAPIHLSVVDPASGAELSLDLPTQGGDAPCP